MKNLKFLFLLSLMTFGIIPLFAQNNVSEKALRNIDSEEIYQFVKTLASPEFEGRYTSHKGYIKAAEWAASYYKKWGLKPINKEQGYLQEYACPITLQDEAEMTLILPLKNTDSSSEKQYKKVKLEVESEFFPFLFSDSGEGEAEVVFAGWGFSAPEAGYDDYANVDVKGKFVLLFRGSPTSDDPRLQEWKSKNRSDFINTAYDKGALGILYVYSKEPIAYTGNKFIKGNCPFLVSETVADMLLEAKGTSFSRIKTDLQNYGIPVSFPLDAKVRYKVKSRHFPDAMSYNVVGYVEGSDPELKKECLYMFAHLDHAGPHVDRIFYGAHDNASGSAVVMELAKTFAKAPKKPKRSVVFVLFTAEEIELGTSYFLDNLPKQFNKVDLVFNYDMVGVGESVNLSLDGQPSGFKEIALEADKNLNIVRPSTGRGFGSSTKRQYPSLYFASGGGHTRFESYHRSSDNIYQINPEIMFNIARFSFLTAYPWANR